MSDERPTPNAPPPPTASGSNSGDGCSYLWDRTGTPDAEIETLEESLRNMRYRGEVGSEARWRIHNWRSSRRLTTLAAAAAAIVLVGVVVLLSLPRPALQIRTWTLEQRSGEVAIDAPDLHDDLHAVAQRVTTRPGASAMLVAKSGARFHLDGDSSVRLVDSSFVPRLSLDHGKVFSETWSGPPCHVTIPAGTALVAGNTAGVFEWRGDGRGLIELKVGHVEFAGQIGSVRLLSGMTCELSNAGASIPVAVSADPLYRKQLAMISDSANAKIDTKMRTSQLDDLLARSRAEDAPTLWNLCWRVGQSERRKVAARLAMLLPVKGPIETDRDGTIDQAAMDQAWDLIVRSR
jgi:hypothetical protein